MVCVNPLVNRKGGEIMSLEKEIKKAIDMANDLCYDEKCKEDLRHAKNEIQIENILKAARRRTND